MPSGVVTTGLATTRTGISGASSRHGGDGPRVLADAVQHVLAVEVLAAGHEPRLELSQTGVHDVVSPIT